MKTTALELLVLDLFMIKTALHATYKRLIDPHDSLIVLISEMLGST